MQGMLRKNRRCLYPPFLQAKLQGGPDYADTVYNTPPEIYRGGVLKIFRRAGEFSYPVAEPDNLGEHLVIEYEVVRVSFQRQVFQYLP